MKVVFITEGGKNFGFGHVVRCAALLEAFNERGIESEFIVNADDTVNGILENIKHHKLDWLASNRKVLRTIGKHDIVIIDSYLANFNSYEEITKRARKAVYIDDYGRMRYPRGTVINSAIYAEELKYPQDNESIYLLGPKYICLRKEFWDICAERKTGSSRKILITFGGMDYCDLIHKIVNYLKDKFEYIFNCIDLNKEKMNASRLLQAILESDVCISGGGQTVHNLARCGLSTIGICLSDNQLLNLKWWCKTGFLEFIGQHKDIDLPQRIERVLKAPDFAAFLKKGAIGQRYIDGQGARRAVEAILAGAG